MATPIASRGVATCLLTPFKPVKYSLLRKLTAYFDIGVFICSMFVVGVFMMMLVFVMTCVYVNVDMDVFAMV